jgi:8-hydroxy-5-deazaflavin:NADPH oxidoreductase
MKVAVLGTGNVGQTIANKLLTLGHEVALGSRSADNPKAIAWMASTNKKGTIGTFHSVAQSSELVFNCTKGLNAIEALTLAGTENLKEKIIIDLSNPLDFSPEKANGHPPTLNPVNNDSLGEQIQRTFPNSFVVKTLNTMNCEIMVNPSKIEGNHVVFVSGNNNDAKNKVKELLQSFGWIEIIDLGDISTSRGVEQLLPLWIRLWQALGTSNFNFALLKEKPAQGS